MSDQITSNSQAILLLTAPLIASNRTPSHDLLTLGEYNRLARLLRDQQKQPADLIGPEAAALLDICSRSLDRDRLETLLARGFLLSQALDRWNTRAIWVVSRADAAYPKRLKARLKEDAPPVLYGCGDAALLEKGGLAVVGSRQVDDELIVYTEEVGRLSAIARQAIVSGGAKGIDRAAMTGALDAGGEAVGVVPDSLERAALSRDNREMLMDHRLALVSPYDPAAGFNVGHAMQRNKLIYALADVAFIVNSDYEKGGTWAGAIEQLERFHFVPLFVRNGETMGKGNSALLRRGAKPWPNPQDSNELCELLSGAAAMLPDVSQQKEIPFASVAIRCPDETEALAAPPDSVDAERCDHAPSDVESASVEPALAVQKEPSPADQLLNAVRQLLESHLLHDRTEDEVSHDLAITKPQAKAWLARLVDEGVLEKLKKPLRYRAARASGRLL
jgi:DNA processing protein